MRGAWFATRHRRGLWQAATIARMANDKKTKSEARAAARFARRAKNRALRAGSASQALMDQQTVEALAAVFEHVAATAQAIDAQNQKRRRRRRMRRLALGATVIGGTAFAGWRYNSRQTTG
jgi:hypothetical protein